MSASRKWSLAGERGSLRQAIVLPFCLGLFSLAYGSVPFLFERQAAARDILLGAPMMISGALTSFALLFTLTARGIRLRAQAGRSPTLFFIAMVGGYLLAGLAVIVGHSYREHRLAADLVDHGVAAQARLVRTFTESCGKTGCSTGVEYVFRPRGSRHWTRGTANEGKTGRNRNPEYDYVVSTGTVPILYDPADPSRSMVYWRDDIHRRASLALLPFEIGLPFGILIVVLAGPVFLLWAIMRDLTKAHAADRAST